MMDRREIDDSLIVKFISGKATPGESDCIIEWLNYENANRLHYFNLKRLWQESLINPEDLDFVDNSWERFRFRMGSALNESFISEENHGMRWSLSRIAVAASIMLLMATTLFYGIQNYRFSRLKETVNQISVPLGSRSKIVLPDGSQVWLNSGSKLFYPSGFSGKNRVATLEGEGFFDVKNDQNSPFIVAAGGLKIKVIGTSFNVKSYPEEKTVETILVKGIVEVNTINEHSLLSPIILAPNQKLTYTKSEGSMNLTALEEGIKQDNSRDLKVEIPDINNFKIATKINPEIFTSWKDGKLIFDGETLESLVPKLERFYNVRISLQDESMNKLKYSGVLEEVTIEEVLRAIESSSSIRFEINKNQVVLKILNK
jgi:transmembrane sensor